MTRLAPPPRPATERLPGACRPLRLRHQAADHWPFLLLFGVGVVLRVAVTLAYQPALEFQQDSQSYLDAARTWSPDVIRPVGYSFFLKMLSVGRVFAVIPVAQHVLGLLTGTLVYLLLRRFGATRWLAALGSSPVLLSAFQLNIEQFVLAESLFTFLVVAAAVLLLWSPRPGTGACALSGALLGAAAVTRTVGLPLIVVGLLFLVATRAGWARFASAGVAAALVVGAYAAWFASVHGSVGIERYSGYFLAGRVAPHADCASLRLPASERELCDERVASTSQNTDWYIWNPESPLRKPDGPVGAAREDRAMSFALHVMRQQPVPYARSVAKDFFHYFAPGRRAGLEDGDMRTWDFPTTYRLDPWQPAYPPADPYVWNWTWPGSNTVSHGMMPAIYGFDLERLEPVYRPSLGRLLRSYQRAAYVQGPFLAVALVVAFGASLGTVDPRHRRLRAGALLLATIGLTMVVLAATTATFDYRYLLPAEQVIIASGVLGAMLATARRRHRQRPVEDVAESPHITPTGQDRDPTVTVGPAGLMGEGHRAVP